MNTSDVPHLVMPSRGPHFSHENPHTNLISHFSGPNSINCYEKMPCGKWEMGCEHFKFLFLIPISHIQLLISNISHPTFSTFLILLLSARP